MSIVELLMEIPADHIRNIFGQYDAYIKIIEKTLNVTVIARDDQVKIIGDGEKAEKAKKVPVQLRRNKNRDHTRTGA